MPYFVVNKQPVFLHNALYNALSEEAFIGKDNLYRARSAINKSKESREHDNLMFTALKSKYRQNPEHFNKDWVCFDLVDKDASENVTDLLLDWCRLYGAGYLSDSRDFVQKMTDDYSGNSLAYPLGAEFVFNAMLRPKTFGWGRLLKYSGQNFRLLIRIGNVYRLKGDLSQFILISKNFSVKIGNDITILPNDYPILEK
jgi:hypothetical protein